MAAGNLGRQRHRAGGRSQDRPRRQAISSAACRTPNYLPDLARPACQRRRARRPTGTRRAAGKAAIHADTPTVAHSDSLGRTFLTVAHNKFKHSNTPPADPPTEEFHRTRVIFDIEGNQREVIDAKDRVVMRYDYDMLGNRIHQASMEAGERWMLNDVAGKPLYAWDSRDHQFRTAYDPLRRPTDSFLREGAGAGAAGRAHRLWRDPARIRRPSNLRGKPVQLFDQAGVVTSDDYDFKGNLLQQPAPACPGVQGDARTGLAVVPLEADDLHQPAPRYDALNRPT